MSEEKKKRDPLLRLDPPKEIRIVLPLAYLDDEEESK